MEKEFLGTTINNVKVFMDEETKEHLVAHSEVKREDIVEAISKVEFIPNADGSFCKTAESVDLNKITGRNSVVKINKDNKKEVQSLYRLYRENPSNVIIGHGPSTTKLMIVIGQIPGEGVMLFTACPGELAPPETDTEFWAGHALYCLKSEIDWERSGQK